MQKTSAFPALQTRMGLPAAAAASTAEHGSTFDTTVGTLADLRKLQDQSKYRKARFSFKLYRRPDTP